MNAATKFSAVLAVMTVVAVAGLQLLNAWVGNRPTTVPPSTTNTSSEPNSSDQPQRQPYVPGEVIVKLKPGTSITPDVSASRATSSQTLNNLLQRIQATEIKSVFYEEHPPLFKQAPAAGSASKDPLLGQVYVIRFNPSIDVAQVVSQLKADPAVEDASPNGYSYAQ